MTETLGTRLEREIREQPAVWRRVAASGDATALADLLRDREVAFVGSGSSLFAAQLGALALRRRGVPAAALAATEVRFEAPAYRRRTVVALSQSGRSRDILEAVETLEPSVLIALTNDPASPLATRADIAFLLDAGLESAVPATKTVTASAAILLWAAALVGGPTQRGAESLLATADAVEAWLDGPATGASEALAAAVAPLRSLVFVGSGYGVPVARELALKVKESSYLHAEGFAAGEFRHGSAALLEAGTALCGIVDAASRTLVARPMNEAARSGALRFTIGESLDEAGVAPLGPSTGEAFNTLAWLVAGQMLALAIGRARGVDGDAPRGLTKFLS
jgi:glucosamine--fructose-6-phosphate aminotransferase (isomerizing)